MEMAEGGSVDRHLTLFIEHELDGFYEYSEQRFWLEASTFSNRGEMRLHLPTDYDLRPHSWLEASTPLSNEQ